MSNFLCFGSASVQPWNTPKPATRDAEGTTNNAFEDVDNNQKKDASIGLAVVASTNAATTATPAENSTST